MPSKFDMGSKRCKDLPKMSCGAVSTLTGNVFRGVEVYDIVLECGTRRT